jgi:hypothetical protein
MMVGCAEHVCMGELRTVQKILSENLKETDHMGDLGVDGRVI